MGKIGRFAFQLVLKGAGGHQKVGDVLLAQQTDLTVEMVSPSFKGAMDLWWSRVKSPMRLPRPELKITAFILYTSICGMSCFLERDGVVYNTILYHSLYISDKIFK